ncbi:hypothetical protein HPB48_001159 [Haemaphysalis longicornis]|uniref:Endonuclease/exonuclease/phosphatase domain-containing protein n=1 Tax=Haemaphysalis longicornis TaxID=44386 RepID=A0A9J6FJY7_HAELO|nr:hypothetical protein HPB48_001159 [Haemaphysalis longicornis]
MLSVALSNATSKHYVNVYVVGDFNAHVDWSNVEAPSPSDAVDDYLLEVVHGAGLAQFAQEASYTAKSGRRAFLDLAFATNATLVHSCKLSPSLPVSDHSLLAVDTFQHLPKYGRFVKTVQLFHKMDVPHLQQLVHLVPWSMALSEESPNDIYEVWLDWPSKKRYIRRTRTNDLAPILARTVRHQNSSVTRVVSFWRSLPSALRSQPSTDADEVKSPCRQAIRRLRTVY